MNLNIQKVIETAERPTSPGGINRIDFIRLEQNGWICISEKTNLFINQEGNLLLNIFNPGTLMNKLEADLLKGSFSHIIRLCVINYTGIDIEIAKMTDFIGIEFEDDFLAVINVNVTNLLKEDEEDQVKHMEEIDLDEIDARSAQSTIDFYLRDSLEKNDRFNLNILRNSGLFEIFDLKKNIKSLATSKEVKDFLEEEIKRLENTYKQELLILYLTKKYELQ